MIRFLNSCLRLLLAHTHTHTFLFAQFKNERRCVKVKKTNFVPLFSEPCSQEAKRSHQRDQMGHGWGKTHHKSPTLSPETRSNSVTSEKMSHTGHEKNSSKSTSPLRAGGAVCQDNVPQCNAGDLSLHSSTWAEF